MAEKIEWPEYEAMRAAREMTLRQNEGQFARIARALDRLDSAPAPAPAPKSKAISARPGHAKSVQEQ